MNAAADDVFAVLDAEEERMSKLGDDIHAAMVKHVEPYTVERAKADAKLVIDEQQDEIDALRSHLAGTNSRRDQRTAALFCIAGVLAAASAGPPFLLLIALVAAGGGIVSWVGRK